MSAKVTKIHPQEQKGKSIFKEEDKALHCCKEWESNETDIQQKILFAKTGKQRKKH
jgi:hypothetical protein